MRLGDAAGDFGAKRRDVLRAERPGAGVPCEILPANELHDEKRLAFMEVEIEDAGNVRMAQLRKNLRLIHQPLRIEVASRIRSACELDDQLLRERGMNGTKDVRLTPAVQPADDV